MTVPQSTKDLLETKGSHNVPQIQGVINNHSPAYTTKSGQTVHDVPSITVPLPLSTSLKQNNLQNFAQIHLPSSTPSKPQRKSLDCHQLSYPEEGITDLNGNRIKFQPHSAHQYEFNRNFFKTSVLYLIGICLFFALLLTSFLSYVYKCVMTGATKLATKGKLYPIQSGASCCWAVESGPFGASSPSNIVIALKVKTSSDFSSLLQRTTKTLQKVISLRTNLSSVSGAQDYYSPYEKLRFIIIEKFMLFCFKLDQDFDVERHIVINKFDSSSLGLDIAMRKQCEFYLAERLPKDRPQWRVHLIHPKDADSGHYGLILVVHHVYGDGISWLQFLRQIAVNQPVKVFIEPFHQPKNEVQNNTNAYNSLNLQSLKSSIRSILLTPHYFALQLTWIWRESNIFHKSYVKKKKTVRWTKLKLSEIKSASKMRNMTFTQVITHCAGGSFKDLFHKHSEEGYKIPSVVFAIAPFARFPYKDLRLTNNFYACFTPLIVNQEQNYFSASGSSPEKFSETGAKESNLRIAELCGNIIAPMQKLFGISARSTMAFTNVPGMSETLRILGGTRGCMGDEVEQICLIPPVKFRTGIVVGLFGYEDRIWLSVCIDEVVAGDPGEVADGFLKGFEHELALLSIV
jgi:hypothetical protein